MKKFVLCVFAVLAVLAITNMAFAETEVVVQGDKLRSELVANFVGSYFPGVTGKAVERAGLGEYVLVTGPGGTERIHFSGKLVAKLKKLAANPKAGQGLMDICPTQAKKLKVAVGTTLGYCEPIEIRVRARAQAGTGIEPATPQGGGEIVMQDGRRIKVYSSPPI